MFIEAFRITDSTYEEYKKTVKRADSGETAIYPLKDIYGMFLVCFYSTITHPGNFGVEWDEDRLSVMLDDPTSFELTFAFSKSGPNKRAVYYK